MPRVKRGVTARARHKKILLKQKDLGAGGRSVYRVAKQAVIRAGQFSYRDRRVKKGLSGHFGLFGLTQVVGTMV